MFLTATKGEMTIKQEYAVPDREIHPGKFAPRHGLCNFAVVFQNCIDEGAQGQSCPEGQQGAVYIRKLTCPLFFLIS